MPKASLSTCHVEFTLVWQYGETWLNLVIITTPALPFRLAARKCFRVTSSRGRGGIFLTIMPKYTLFNY